MTFSQSISHVLTHYADFRGRAARSEYWWWGLFSFLLNVVFQVIESGFADHSSAVGTVFFLAFALVSMVVGLGLIIPSLAVSVRRFHDMDRSGWWLLLGLTGIGALVIFFWFMRKGTEGPNRFGPDPLEFH